MVENPPQEPGELDMPPTVPKENLLFLGSSWKSIFWSLNQFNCGGNTQNGSKLGAWTETEPVPRWWKCANRGLNVLVCDTFSLCCFQWCRIVWRCLPLRRTWRTRACMSRPTTSVLCSGTARPCPTDSDSPTTSFPYPATTQNLLVNDETFFFLVFFCFLCSVWTCKHHMESFQTALFPFADREMDRQSTT